VTFATTEPLHPFIYYKIYTEYNKRIKEKSKKTNTEKKIPKRS